ncbi:MAG TPA: DoxX family protein [Opitutaceae bacterium]|nr:DoxX family protein [Opitutaceae bacterium]
MSKWLALDFLPRNVDLGLLVLRLGLGVPMLMLHGWGKLMSLLSGEARIPDVLGIGSMATLILAVLAEVVCSALLILGLWTRLAAAFLIATMGCAFALAHKFALTGGNSGELALIYLVGFLVIFFAGAGKYSVDKK